MVKHIVITQGPYRGQTLQLEDDVAAAAVKDKWGVDPAAEGHDPYSIEQGAAGGDLPESLQKFLNPQAEAPKVDEKAEARAAPKTTERTSAKTEVKDDDDNTETSRSSTRRR